MMLIQSCLNWGGRSLRALHSSDVFHFNLPLRLMDSPKTRWSIWTPFFSYENVLSVPPSQPSWNLCYWRKHGLVRNFFTFLQWTSRKTSFFRKRWAHSPDKALYQILGQNVKVSALWKCATRFKTTDRKAEPSKRKPGRPRVAKREPRCRLRRAGDRRLSQTEDLLGVSTPTQTEELELTKVDSALHTPTVSSQKTSIPSRWVLWGATGSPSWGIGACSSKLASLLCV